MNLIKTLVVFLLTYTSGKTINSGDNIIQQQSNFMELMDAASNMYQHLSSSEALMKMIDIPEFRELTGGSPFELNNVTEIVDEMTGDNLASFDWDKLHQETQKLKESNAATGPMGKSINDEWNELVKQASGLKSKGRKLEAVTAGVVAVAVAPVVVEKTIDLVSEYIKWTISAHDEVSNYDEIYKQITDSQALSAASNKKLDKAEKKKDMAKDSIKLAFKVVKASVFDLYSELKGHYRMFDLFEQMQGPMFEQSRQVIETMYVEQSKAAIVVFRRGVMSTEANIKNAKEHVKAGEKIIDDVQDALEKESIELKKSADGKSEDFKDFKVEQRAIAYGTCTGITIASGGMGAVPCFATAAAILETAIANYQAKHDKMWRDVTAARKQISVVLKRADKLDVSFEKCNAKIKMLDAQINEWVKATNTDKGILAITKDRKTLDWFVNTLDNVHNGDQYQIDFV